MCAFNSSTRAVLAIQSFIFFVLGFQKICVEKNKYCISKMGDDPIDFSFLGGPLWVRNKQLSWNVTRAFWASLGPALRASESRDLARSTGPNRTEPKFTSSKPDLAETAWIFKKRVRFVTECIQLIQHAVVQIQNNFPP